MAQRYGNGDREKTSIELISCGLVSGLLQAGVFNPWDRALYLSIKDNRAFLHMDNFRNPFSGVAQTIVQRALSTGLYFPLEEIYRNQLSKVVGVGAPSTFAAGILSGITSGVIMNPIAAVKYHYWGTPTGKENFLSTSLEMFKRGGVRVFVVGTGATVNRDLVFGGVYALMRHELLTSAKNDEDRKNNKKKTPPGFLVNLISACIATVASSPWNYVRNVHYATEKGQSPLPSWAIVRGLWDDAMREGSLFERVRFLQTRLRIGWGTVRVLLVAKNGLALQNSPTSQIAHTLY